MAMVVLQDETKVLILHSSLDRQKSIEKLNTYEYTKYPALYFYHQMYLVVVVAMDELDLPSFKNAIGFNQIQNACVTKVVAYLPVQFVDLVASERHCSPVHVRWFADGDVQRGSLVHNAMELVVVQLPVVFDTLDWTFQVSPCYLPSIAQYRAPIAAVLVALLLVVVQQQLAELASVQIVYKMR